MIINFRNIFQHYLLFKVYLELLYLSCLIFYSGSFDKCVLAIREENKEKDMGIVVANVFSHANVAKKNVLVVKLIVSKSLV